MPDLKDGQEQIQLTGTKSPMGYDTTGSTGGGDQQDQQNQQAKSQQVPHQNPDYYIPKVYQEGDEVCVHILNHIQWRSYYGGVAPGRQIFFRPLECVVFNVIT